MAKNKKYTVSYKRKREGKTDYKKRIKLLASRIPRIIVRKSANNFILQLAEFNPKGDKIILTVNSQQLKKIGWKGHTGNLCTAYLTGLLFGEKSKDKKVKNAILDTGIYTPIKGSSIYAALQGVIDSGVKVPHSEEILIKESRIKGEHIASYAKLISQDKARYEKQFSVYLKNNLKPEDLPKHFEEIKNKILKEGK